VPIKKEYMKPKKLSYKDYLKYFQFNRHETGCGVETERESWENFLWLQTFLPKNYFELNSFDFISNTFMPVDSIPDEIHVKFELFGIGSIGNRKAFVFKPWIINIDNPNIYNNLEKLHLFIPDYLFYNLIERLIFIEQFNWDQLNNLRVLEDISETEFEQFGLNKPTVPEFFMTERLRITKISNFDTNEIKKFYQNNWDVIESNLEHKYFRPKYNVWFKIEEVNSSNTIGYLRLYNSNSSFNGGSSIEYIVSKNKQGKGIATEATKGIISFLKKYSLIHNLGAEIQENNEKSINVLLKCGFVKSNSNNWVIKENYFLNIVDKIDLELSSQINEQKVNFSIQNIYAERYSRYFN
jgi:RimJ/RimL family protein N-acetyltransferase